MSNFLEQCMLGDVLPEEIYLFIEEWHHSDSNEPLYRYLGMTKLEYALFIEDETYLGPIVSARLKHTGVKDFVKSIALAARSDDQSKSKRLERWLRQEGLWE